jgi:hypothetical protein
MGLVAALLSAAVLGAVRSQRWSRFLVYGFAAILIVQWLRFVVPEFTSGFLLTHLSGMPPLHAILVFVPAGFAFLLTGYCCYVASRYFGISSGTSNQRQERP